MSARNQYALRSFLRDLKYRLTLHCRDSEKSSKCQIFEIEFPSKFVETNLDQITETAKTAKFMLIV